MSGLVLGSMLALLVAGTPAEPQAGKAVVRLPDPNQGASPALAELLGDEGRRQHARRLATLKLDGKTHPWKTWSDWGKELFFTAQVAQPPVGPVPSKPLSEFYRCQDCHNYQREDAILTLQDPEARFQKIRKQPPSSNSNMRPLYLAPGTTVWGIVNRESFYNDSFEAYHGLTVVGDREMDPTSLEDATQVCCSYCSVGRFAEPWEIAALLTWFWDLELRLEDLDLPPAVATAVRSVLERPDASDPAKVAQTRDFLRRLYLRRAGDTATAPPAVKENKIGPYFDKLQFQGDPAVGKDLYRHACNHCHGEGKPNESAGADLIHDLQRFHAVLAKGTTQEDEPYMPMFTAQRLSRQQIADIQAYLESLE